MSVKLMSAAWDAKVGGHLPKMVLLSLADNANDSGVCRFSVLGLAKRCGMPQSDVLASINLLESKGFITPISDQKLRINAKTLKAAA